MDSSLQRSLSDAAESPAHAVFAEIWQEFDRLLATLPPEKQLRVGASAIAQLADILHEKAEVLIQEWEQRGNTLGPVVNVQDLFAGLVRQTVNLELGDLKEPEEPRVRKQKERTPTGSDSVVAPIDKQMLLSNLDDLLALAGQEEPTKWSQAIALYLQAHPGSVKIEELGRSLNMPLVEVWLGLLLGGYTLQQKGDFYSSEVWIDGQF